MNPDKQADQFNKKEGEWSAEREEIFAKHIERLVYWETNKNKNISERNIRKEVLWYG